LGQDIFGGIMDEVAFSKSPGASQVRELYDAVKTRIESRFMSDEGRVPGLLCVASSANYEGDFLDDHLKSSQVRDKVHVSQFALYEMKSYPGVKFRVLVGDKIHASQLLDEVYTDDTTGLKAIRPVLTEKEIPRDVRIETVPNQFYDRFVDNIERQIRDVCGIPLFATSPFFPHREKLYEAVELYEASGNALGHPFEKEDPVISLADDDVTLEALFLKEKMFVEVDRFRKLYRPRINPGVPRFIHGDLAKNQCSAGLACCHLYGFKTIIRADETGKEQEIRLPVVYVDFMLRIRPPKGSEIDFTKITSFIFFLRNMGLPIGNVSFDQYQSRYAIQLFQKAGLEAGEVSMDRNPSAYNSLKETYNAGTILTYEYQPIIDEIATLQREVSDRGVTKIQHAPNGSKDVADSLAGAHYSLVTSKYVEERMQEMRPEQQQYKKLAGRPRDDMELGAKWLYSDIPEADRITDIYK
jgi:hypothetical protein